MISNFKLTLAIAIIFLLPGLAVAARLATGTVPKLEPLQIVDPGAKANLGNNIKFQDPRGMTGSSPAANTPPGSASAGAGVSGPPSNRGGSGWPWLVMAVSAMIIIYYFFRRRNFSKPVTKTPDEESHIKYG